MIKPQTLKGFRDFLPKEAKKRQYAIDAIKRVFESYGFEPLETPAIEYEEVLLGKYGEEGDKLMYRFKDKGGRKVALRYDQTVPLARVVAQYGSQLPTPFKRYQIQPVWRGENPQKGRFREFLQCDADIVGSSSPLSDAEVIATAIATVVQLGFKNYKVLINDRTLFEGIPSKAITIIDKIKKIGKEKVFEELLQNGFDKNLLDELSGKTKTERLEAIYSALSQMGVNIENVEFDSTLARGLDYYTSTIFEIELGGYSAGSVCGGGRFDNLIGMFAGKSIPAVGFAFGFDRLMEAMDELKLFPADLSATKVLVTIFSPELKEKSLNLAFNLRGLGVNTELYLDETATLDKQLKYADQKQIPYTIIIGPQEVEKNVVTLRNMKTREQKQVPFDEISKAVSNEQ